METITVNGIVIQLWDKSFKVEGMSQVYSPPNITQETVVELVTAVYDQVRAKAEGEAIERVSRAAYRMTLRNLKNEL